MNTLRITLIAAFALAAALLGQAAYSNGMVCNARYDIGQKWLATGTVTKVEGTTFFLLGKDNQVYKIHAAESQVFIDEEKVNREAWAVGDTVRVFGEVIDPCVISAERIRIFQRDDAGTIPEEPRVEREVKIIIEREPAVPSGQGAGVQAQPNENINDWQGLVTNVNYGARGIDIRTSLDSFSVAIGDATIIEGPKRVTFGMINIGDAVYVTGTYAGLNRINAQRVEIIRHAADAQNALPTTHASLVGTILNIDYASGTFRMQTSSTEVVVMVGPEALIQHHHERWMWTDLAPGQRIKMSGYGSLGSGYAAQHIMVISVAP